MFIADRRISSLIFVVTAFASSRTAENKDPVNPDPHDEVCRTPECREMGIMLGRAINRNINPCDDFYDYVCKNWKENNTIPIYLPSYGHLWLIREKLAKRLKDILGNMTVPTYQAESLNEKIAIAYHSCMNEDSCQPDEEIYRLRNTLKEFGIPKWPMIPGSNETIDWKEIYRKIRVGADMSFIFSVTLSPHLFNTSQPAIYVQASKFVPSSHQLSMAREKKDSAVQAYEDFIKQTVFLFSEDKDINVMTKIAQDIFDFEVNLTKKIYDLGFELPDFPDYNYTYDYPDDYEEESSSTIEPELTMMSDKEETCDTRIEARSLLKKLSKLETAFMATLWNEILERFDKTSVALQRPGLDLSTAVDLLNSLDGFASSLRPKFEAFEEEAVALSVEKCYKGKLTRDTSRQLTAVEEAARAHGSRRFEVDTFYIILDNLSSALRTWKAAYTDLCEKFQFLKLLRETGSEDELREEADGLVETYKADLESTFSTEVVQFSHYLKSCVLHDTSARGLLQFPQERDIVNVFPNVPIALRICHCIPVSNCESERSFSKLCLIKNCLRSTLSEEKLNSLAILSIERDILRQIFFDDTISKFLSLKSRKVSF